MKDKYDIFFDKDNNVYQVRTRNNGVTVEFSDKEQESIFIAILALYKKKTFTHFLRLKKNLLQNIQPVKYLMSYSS